MRAPKRELFWALFALVCLTAVFVFSRHHFKDSGNIESENVWRRPLFIKLQTLDSGNLTDAYSINVASQIYEPLYEFHYLKRPFELVPLLAEDMPEISQDHLTYKIRIKKNVFFQDDACFPDGKGRELKADDFVYAIKRIANVKYKSQNWSDFDGRIVGLNEFREFSKQFKSESEVDYGKEVEGIRALDDYTLQIKLTRPWPQLTYSLALPIIAPVAREAVEYYGQDIMFHPVGTGAYKLKTWDRGVYIELVRNQNWHGGVYPSEGSDGDLDAGLLDDAGKPLAMIDRLIYRIIEEFQPAWLMFKRGELEWMQTFKDNFNEAVNTATLEATQEMKDRGIELILYDDPSVFWLGFNMQDPVLGKNKPLRKAISRAINRKEMIDVFFNGIHKVAHGFIPPALAEYNPEIVNTDYSMYSLNEARTLVKEAETLNGTKIPPLSLSMPGSGVLDRQMGQYLQRSFERIGLQLKIDYMDWPTYLDVINKGQHQIFFSGASPSIPDAVGSLKSFQTKAWGPGGNHFFYSDPEYDKLYDQIEIMFPGKEKNELCHLMEKMILDDYAAVFINHRVSTVMVQSWFENYKPNVFAYNTAKYWKIDIAKRNQYKDLLKDLKRNKKIK